MDEITEQLLEQCQMKEKPDTEYCESCDYRFEDECIYEEIKNDGFVDNRFV